MNIELRYRSEKCFQLAMMLSIFGAALIQCAAPINRGTVKPEPKTAPAKFETPDLKKRILVITFRDPLSFPDRLKDLPIAKILTEKINEAFGRPTSPYLMLSPEDEDAFKVFSLTSAQDPKEITRLLHGSDVAGFIIGEVTPLEVLDTGGDSEGLVKSKTMKLNVGVKYDLYDCGSGKKIASASDTKSYSETRSDLFGSGKAIPELDKKFVELAVALGNNVVDHMTPFAEKLAWSGRVLRMDGPRVYLNAGRRTGILLNDILKVVERSRPVMDPQTGVSVGEAPGRIKATVKVLQYFGNDGAVAVLQSGGGIVSGDAIELF